MDIILKSNIKKLGKVGDIVSVKSGYARNYLLPSNKAVRKTEENIKKFEVQKKELEEKETLIREKAENTIKTLKDVKLIFNKESDENGQLYGSIQAREILLALKDKSIDLNADNIVIRKQIKSIGSHEIEVHPYHELSIKINILVNSLNKE